MTRDERQFLVARVDNLLILLAEAAAGVVRRAGVAARLGIDGVVPGHAKDNCERLEEKIGELLAVVELLGLEGLIFCSANILAKYHDRKVAKVEKLLAHSQPPRAAR